MNVIKWNGKPISKPGWYSGIPIERYHSANMCDGPAVSSSNLRTCWSKSAAHMYLEWAENPDRVERPSAAHLLLGGVAHHLLLGEEGFKTRYVAQPDTYRDKVTAQLKPWNNNADVCRRWHRAQRDAGRVVVKTSDLDAVIAMSKSLALEPLVQEGLLRGHVECSGFARDAETGLWLKVRPDVIPTMTGDFVDMKTAYEVTTVALQLAIRSHGYHQQGGLIWEVVEQLGADHPFQSFVLLFVESAAPWCARTVPLTDEDLSLGRLQNRAMMRHIATCIEGKHWPGPGEGDMHPLPIGNDARERIRQRLQFEGLQ